MTFSKNEWHLEIIFFKSSPIPGNGDATVEHMIADFYDRGFKSSPYSPIKKVNSLACSIKPIRLSVCLFLSVCLSFCPSIPLSFYPPTLLSICTFVTMSVSVSPSVHLSIVLSFRSSGRPSVHSFVHPSVRPSVRTFVRLSAYPSANL